MPRKLNPNPRAEFALKNTRFESICVECQCSDRQKSKQLGRLACIPNKSKTVQFPTDLQLTIDTAITEKNIFLMGDYNISYLDQKESESM